MVERKAMNRINWWMLGGLVLLSAGPATTQPVNLLQGAIVYHGQGHVAVLGEAAMFSAQLAGPNKRPMGMNSPEASENYRFALNVLHWLSGGLK